MAVGADDVEAAEFGDSGAQADIGATSGHVGGNRDAAEFAGAGDDGGFLRFIFGVEQVVGKVAEQGGELL